MSILQHEGVRNHAKHLLRIPAFGIAIALTAVISGCGASAPAPSTSTAIDDSPATGTIELWAASGEDQSLAKLISGFEAVNPEAKVNLTVIPAGELNTRLQTAIAAGTTPDLTYLTSATIGALLATNAFASVPEGLADPSAFFKPAYDLTYYEGVAHAVPWYTQTRALFIRKDLMEKAGLEPPATWEDYLPFTRALVRAGAKQGLSLAVSWDKFTAVEINTIVNQGGGSIINKDHTKWTLDDPKVVAALDFYLSLFGEGGASPDGPGYLDLPSMFVNGQLGAFQSGPFSVASLNTAADDPEFAAKNVVVAPLPAGPAGYKGQLDCALFGVFKDANNSDAAWKLIRYLSLPETQIELLKLQGLPPAVISATKDPLILDDPILSVFAEQMPNAVASPQVSTLPQVLDIIAKQAERVVRGEVSAKEAMAEAQRLADSVGTGD